MLDLVPAAKKKPILLWMVAVLYLALFALLALIACATALKWSSLPPETKTLLSSAPWSTWARALGLVATLVGTIQIFRLRRSALYFIGTGLAFAIVSSLVVTLTGGLSANAISGPIAAGFVLAHGLQLRAMGLPE